ncbi:MAG: homoserine kinase [Candidatus Acidiferrales bacterium]
MTSPRQRSIEVRVPASTANLGAGFDCLGLALELYLTARATVQVRPDSRTLARTRGVSGSSLLPRAPEQNLIFRAMRYAAEQDGFQLPAVRLAVNNEIPMAGGLGSSAAAAVAGIALAYAVTGRPIARENALRYAKQIEGHADNAGAALLGGLVVTYTLPHAGVGATRLAWPKMIRVVAVTPALELPTKKSRAVLPASVLRDDAVLNLQRSALFVAAIEERRYDLIWDAMQDRLHQRYRQKLIPGLAEVLSMPRIPGLLGLALSGAGPSVVALATAGFDEIGKTIAACFERAGVAATIRLLEVAHDGISILENRPRRR